MTAREEQEDEERISFLGTNDHDDLSISGRSSHHQRHNKSKTPSSNVVASSTIPSTVAATSLSRKGFIVAATVVFVTVCVAKYSSTNYTSTNAMIDTVEKPPLVPTPPPTPTATPPSADDETSSSSRTTTNDATDASPEVPNSDSASRSSAGTGTSNGKTKKKNSSLKPPEKNTPTDSKPAAAVTADAEQVLYPVPLDNESLSKGFKKMTAQLSDVYLRRGKALSVEAQQAITNQWGEWNFVAPQSPPPKDRDAQQQSQQDEFQSLVESYSNGDIPRSVLVSSNGWQTDPAYLAEWLPQALALVERSMEAMLGEYGHSKFDQPDKDLTERSFMFRVDGFAKQGYSIKHPPGNGGYSTPATLKAIQKRLLHAVMTQGTFVFVMGGHSAAAGHGNHFQQSYTLQVQRVLEPVLARLGVYHKSHNYGVGGMGTLQNGLASADLYGPRMDILLWDCGMTEGDETVKDLFARTGLLTGETVPVLWGDPDGCRYDQQAVPGIGCIQTTFYGAGMAGLAKTEDPVQASQVPFAARYLNCGQDAKQICGERRYNTTCWIPRDDAIEPKTKQKSNPSGQASWHPGNRYQQLQGRIIAFVILQQLYNGLSAWNNTAPLYALPDKAWHLSADFTKIRSAVSNITDSPCYNLPLPNKICHVKLHAKSEFTPRYNPAETSIRSIIKEGVFIPKPPPNMYDPPEPHLDVFDAPGKQLDVLSILENGGDFLPNPARRHALLGRRLPTRRSLTGNATSGAQNNQRRAITSGLEPGQGWGILTKSAPDNCDGSWDSFCGRSADNDCLLNGHNDLRGGLGFDSYSGWMIVNLYKVKHGIIIIRVEDWWGPGNVKRTAGWNCENNKNCPEAATKAADTTDQPRQRQVLESPRPHSEEDRRGLGENPNRCSDFTFEFAIDGKVTSWDRTAWDANRKQIQRVAHMWLLMDDSNYTGGEEKDVELAIRLTGCQRETTFGLSHIYWA